MRKRDEGMEYATALPSPLTRVRASTSSGHVSRGDDTDERLLLLVGDGDANAFERLYRRYARAVFGLALRRLGDRERAEDAVQETFAAVWRSAGTYEPARGPGGPWLFAVARNAIVDRLRGRTTEPIGDPPDVPDSARGPDERAETGWLAWRVHRALEDLPETERAVLELAYWGGLSQSEVATFLNVPLGTVKTRTRAGLARLADALEGEDL